MLKSLAAAAVLLAAPALADDDPVFGRWKVESGKAVVEISPCGASACGVVSWLREPLGDDGKPVRDMRNKDAGKRGGPVCGSKMLWGFKRVGAGDWEGGKIYNAEDGDVYSAEMTAAGDTLKVRGYVGLPIFGKSQVWSRVGASPAGC